MDLLYDVISEYINEIIKKKRAKIQELKESTNVEYNEKFSNKIYDLHRQINYLNVCKGRINEFLSFISDMDD